MNNKVIAVIVGLLVVIGIGYAVMSNKNTPDGDADDAYKTSQQVSNTKNDEVEDADGDEKSGVTVEVNPGSVVKPKITVETTTKTFTMAEVQQHNSASSCYTVVNGSVYDVTAWISKHPGGEKAIVSMCGKDASAAYDKQHNTQARPASELASFKIGTLTK